MEQIILTCDACGHESKRKNSGMFFGRRRRKRGQIDVHDLDLCAACKRGLSVLLRSFLKDRKRKKSLKR